MSALKLQSERSISECFGGFQGIEVPEEDRREGAHLVIFDREYAFCQFEVTRVRADGSVDTSPALPWGPADGRSREVRP